jgi:hypothetical protein
MILTEHIPHLRRLEPYMRPPMLMLGRQTNTSAYRFPCDYKTMDLDGGDFLFDLGDEKAHQKTIPVPGYHLEAYRTVFNLGTLEHVWDAHTAHVNAADMVALGGHFLGQVPVAGWEGHGIHVTDWKAVQAFFGNNGFAWHDMWFTTQAGTECDAPKRNGGKSILLWFAAQRISPAAGGIWRKPSQVYVDGKKPA